MLKLGYIVNLAIYHQEQVFWPRVLRDLVPVVHLWHCWSKVSHTVFRGCQKSGALRSRGQNIPSRIKGELTIVDTHRVASQLKRLAPRY